MYSPSWPKLAIFKAACQTWADPSWIYTKTGVVHHKYGMSVNNSCTGEHSESQTICLLYVTRSQVSMNLINQLFLLVNSPECVCIASSGSGHLTYIVMLFFLSRSHRRVPTRGRKDSIVLKLVVIIVFYEEKHFI